MQLLLAPLAALVGRRPRLIVLVAVLLTVVFGVLATRQTTDTDLTSFSPDTAAANALVRIGDEFGSGGESLQIVVDAGPGGNVWTRDALAVAVTVEDVLSSRLDGLGADDAAVLRIDNFATPVLGELTARGTGLADAPDALLDELIGGILAGGFPLTSIDADPGTGRAEAGLVVVSFSPTLPFPELERLSLELAAAVDELTVAGVDLAPFNAPVLGAALQEQSDQEMPRLLAVSLLLILGILMFQFRSVSDVLIGMAGLVAAIMWMTGISVLLGPEFAGLVGPFSQIATIVPVLLVGLGIDYAIHVTSRYREERAHGAGPEAAAAMAVRTVGGALTLATVTTTVGFLTNLASPLPPLVDFGVFTAVGVLSAFVIMTAVVPAARNLLDARPRRRPRRRREHRPETGFSALVGRLAVLAERAPRVVLAVAITVTVLAGGAATQVSTAFSQDDFIPSGSDIERLLDRIDVLFAGDVSETTFVLIDGDLQDEALLASVEGLPDELRDIDGIRPGDQAIDVLVTPDAALVTMATAAGQDGVIALTTAIDGRLGGVRAAGGETVVTSEFRVIDDALEALTANQTRGIVLTLTAALLLLVAYFGWTSRSPLLGVITMVPSLAVVTWVLGTMWLLGISFNVLTAMVASIGIGIGVPYGIHITYRFLEDRRRLDTVEEAIRSSLEHTGGAMAGSAATTAGGFGVLAFASLLPIQQFGLIVALTIVYSFVAAVLVQPALLGMWGRRRARLGDHGVPLAHEGLRTDDREPVGARSRH